jgi:homoserine dehydrogenase
VAVRRVAGDRGVAPEMLTDNVEDLVSREDVDIVVEVMGPVEPARKAILTALEHGKSVVTANKALLSQSTGELAEAAERARVDLYFEAAVAGAIPVIRPLTQSLAGDTVVRVAGIVNGTTNYILSEMASTGADYASALADASALGYAEADPSADVEGYDAAAKAAILASIAFHTRVTADDARSILDADPHVPADSKLCRNFMGQLFKTDHWEATGQVIRSRTTGSHGNLLFCWRLRREP